MKIHLIFNAHIDPVWLWPWQAGLDEVLASCRSACDRLDAHSDLIFTRGEAWVYRQIERTDPKLFERIETHIHAGRWEITGGWWLQPDCNLPGSNGMRRQIELGRAYFERRFGYFPRIAYNVDSFGHAASLPGLMRSQDQDCYIMMRPQEHEMRLPARLFRWRGYEDGPEVLTFRIAHAYTSRELTREHITAALTQVPPGVEHTMCFVGIGDHGGGPTESQISWLRENWDAFPGHQLEFSSPQRFFDAVEAHRPNIPLVTGELQQHAVGCYSVYRPIKVAVQRAEHALAQAENLLSQIEAGPVMEATFDADVPTLGAAWQRVCFAHFHDTLGGTCLPSAYPAELDRVGFARSVAEETASLALRKLMKSLPDDLHQRIVLFNASNQPFNDWVEFEPWLEWQRWGRTWWLADTSGTEVSFQVMTQEALNAGSTRLMFRASIPASGFATFQIRREGKPSSGAVMGSTEDRRESPFADFAIHPPQVQLLHDDSDTWSHGLSHYAKEALETPVWGELVPVDSGPLMSSWIQVGAVGQSSLAAEWRRYGGDDFLELRLKVHWREQHRLLKLVWPLDGVPGFRVDGISGGALRRANDGRELPLRDFVCLPLANGLTTQSEIGTGRGVVCPDVFAADATPDRLRLTLLRSALMAHHEPHSGVAPRRTFSDQGEHIFRFRFYPACDIHLLETAALAFHEPPLAADLTRGMPTHISELSAAI